MEPFSQTSSVTPPHSIANRYLEDILANQVQQPAELQNLVVAVAILITVILIVFTMYAGARAFREFITLQTKIEALFSNIDLAYIQRFRLEEPSLHRGDSKQGLLLRRVYETKAREVLSKGNEVVASCRLKAKYAQLTKKYNRLVFSLMRRCLVNNQKEQDEEGNGNKKKMKELRLLEPRTTLYGFVYQLILLAIWFMACLSMSIANKTQTSSPITSIVTLSIFIITPTSSILSLLLTYFTFRTYRLSFLTQLHAIFHYQPQSQIQSQPDNSRKEFECQQEQTSLYQHQTLALQNWRFIIKFFAFVAVLCIAFAICVYQLMIMQYEFKIATGVIFLITPFADILLVRQVLILCMALFQLRSKEADIQNNMARKVTLPQQEPQPFELVADRNPEQSLFSPLPIENSFIQQPDEESSFDHDGMLMMNKSQGSFLRNSHCQQKLEQEYQSPTAQLNDLFQQLFKQPRLNQNEQEDADQAIKVLFSDDRQLKLLDLILLSYTEQTYGDKGAYKILKNLLHTVTTNTHDDTYDFIEKVKVKVFNQSQRDLEQNLAYIEDNSFDHSRSSNSSTLLPLIAANDLRHSQRQLDVVEELISEENSKSSKVTIEEDAVEKKESERQLLTTSEHHQRRPQSARRKLIRVMMKKELQQQQQAKFSQTLTGSMQRMKEQLAEDKQMSSSQKQCNLKDLLLLCSSQKTPSPAKSKTSKVQQSARKSQRSVTESGFNVIEEEVKGQEVMMIEQEDGRNRSILLNPFIVNEEDETSQRIIGQGNDDDTSYITTNHDNQFTEDGCSQDKVNFQKTSETPYKDLDDNPLANRVSSDEGTSHHYVSFNQQPYITTNADAADFSHYFYDNELGRGQDNQMHRPGLTLQDLADEQIVSGQQELQDESDDQEQHVMNRYESRRTLKRNESNFSKIYDESTLLKTLTKQREHQQTMMRSQSVLGMTLGGKITGRKRPISKASQNQQALTLQNAGNEGEESKQGHHGMIRSRSQFHRITLQYDRKTLKRIQSANRAFNEVRKKSPIHSQYLQNYQKFISPLHSPNANEDEVSPKQPPSQKRSIFNRNSSGPSIGTFRQQTENDDQDKNQQNRDSSLNKDNILMNAGHLSIQSLSQFDSSIPANSLQQIEDSQVPFQQQHVQFNLANVKNNPKKAGKRQQEGSFFQSTNSNSQETTMRWQRVDGQGNGSRANRPTSSITHQNPAIMLTKNLNRGGRTGSVTPFNYGAHDESYDSTSQALTIKFNDCDSSSNGGKIYDKFINRVISRQDSQQTLQKKEGLPPLGSKRAGQQQHSRMTSSRSEAQLLPGNGLLLQNKIDKNQLFKQSIAGKDGNVSEQSSDYYGRMDAGGQVNSTQSLKNTTANGSQTQASKLKKNLLKSTVGRNPRSKSNVVSQYDFVQQQKQSTSEHNQNALITFYHMNPQQQEDSSKLGDLSIQPMDY